MAPTSRRRILPSQTLASFGAMPIYPPSPSSSRRKASAQEPSSSQTPSPSSTATTTSTTTTTTTAAPTTTTTTTTTIDDEEIRMPVGIRIAGWEIVTRNSAIGDECGMARLTSSLEGTANDNDDVVVVGGYDDDDRGVDPTSSSSRRRRRRLNPPEITFMDAVVSCRYLRGEGKLDRGGGLSTIAAEDDGGDDASVVAGGMRLDAKDALLEWAEAHRCLGMTHHPASTSTTREDEDDEGDDEKRRRGHRGVSIVRTADAEIRSNRPRDDDDDDDDEDAASTSRDSVFHYDWTFSSPYAGTVVIDPRKTYDGNGTTNGTTINNRQMWRPLRRSRIPYRMLQDNTQPILLYDDVHLYEDDLHDNGDVSLNAKIRVMPKYWYALQRLFVRVDRVCVRCREVRYFCSFFDDEEVGVDDCHGVANDDGAVRANTIYRDVTWREATWEEIGDAGMPTDPAAWRENDNAGGSFPAMQTPPPLASLLTRLPSVSLPGDIPRFSYFDVNPRMKD